MADLSSPDEVAEYLNRAFTNGNDINPKLKVDAGIGLMLYWVGYELNRLTDAITGAPGVQVQDEAPPVSGEGPEEGGETRTGSPMDADALGQDEGRD